VDDNGTANIPSAQTYNINGAAHTHGVTTGGTGVTACAKGDIIVGSGSNTASAVNVGTNNYLLIADSAQGNGVRWATDDVAIEFVIDGGGSAIATGSKGFLEVPFACTIIRVTTLAQPASSSIVVDIKKSTYANFPSTSSICASAKPTISSAQRAQDSTLTGWTTAIAAGDILEFNVDSATTVTNATVALKVTKTR
jgi:hypothetical protein